MTATLSSIRRTASACAREAFPRAEALALQDRANSSYWPLLTALERRAQLYRTWREIVSLLGQQIDGVAVHLPELNDGASSADMKSFEDKLDAIVCAWVAICCLEDKAVPYGDEGSSIWISFSFSRTRLTFVRDANPQLLMSVSCRGELSWAAT